MSDPPGDLLGIVVKPLDLHLVNVGSIPTGPTHGEERLQPHPWDVLNSTLNVQKSPRSNLYLEGRLSDPQIFQTLRSVMVGMARLDFLGNSRLKTFGDRSASPDTSLIWGSSGHSGWS